MYSKNVSTAAFSVCKTVARPSFLAATTPVSVSVSSTCSSASQRRLFMNAATKSSSANKNGAKSFGHRIEKVFFFLITE